MIRQHEPIIPEGMVRWHGGEASPSDWDGGPVLLATGATIPNPYTWATHYAEGYPAPGRVFAYTPKSPAKPHPAPSPSEVGPEVERLRKAITRALQCTPVVRNEYVGLSGLTYRQVIAYDCGDPWAILREALSDRATVTETVNVAPEQFAENAKSSVALTDDQSSMLRDVLQFVSARQGPFSDEADQCLALLPEPVDADEAEAASVIYDHEADDLHATVLAAIKRGRALERGEG